MHKTVIQKRYVIKAHYAKMQAPIIIMSFR